MDLGGKVVIVTGGTRGIGKAISLAFARRKAQVIPFYHSQEAAALELQEEAATINLGPALAIKQVSVTDLPKLKHTMREIKETYGRIDILINNAGVFRTGYLATANSEECSGMIDVNLKGVIYATMAVSRIMIGQRQGHIVNIASVAGLTPFPGTAVYAAAKAGVIAFTKSVASELGSYGIMVSGLAPGLTDTEMIQGLDETARRQFMTVTGSQRLLAPEEIADWAVSLAGPLARNIQGQTIALKGWWE